MIARLALALMSVLLGACVAPSPSIPSIPSAPSAASAPPSATSAPPASPAATTAQAPPVLPLPEPSSPAPAPPAASPAPSPPSTVPVDPDQPPPAPREFRAAWVATVSNIDWPSKPGLPVETQKAEALAMLERARTLGLNALILQVRPAGDAIYPSALEPWSEYLTGEQGRAPLPRYDPLAFWIQQAHRRAIELHVWFNPYRARHSSARTPLVTPHLGQRQPALVKRYGDMLWMDPGEAAAAAHTLAVVADVVRRYDIDGVHIDDYFYPYPVAHNGADLPFPDDESYSRYRLNGGMLARDDWRRSNVDALVQQLHTTIHRIKPWVRFGISPFGLGRPERRPAGIMSPGGSNGSNGFSQYDKLYADVERWLGEGWLDYLAPQLYWPIERAGLQFPLLLDQWISENKRQRHLWPGLFTSQVTRGETPGPRAWPAREIVEQIRLQRQRGDKAGGHIHFSMIALMQDRDGIATQLQAGTYAQPALVPASPWLDESIPPTPGLRVAGPRLNIEPGSGEAAARWAVWRRKGGSWRFAVLAGAQRQIDIDGAELVAVSAVGRVGNLSAAQVWRLP